MNENKTEYVAPEISISIFDKDDIIVTSSNETILDFEDFDGGTGN